MVRVKHRYLLVHILHPDVKDVPTVGRLGASADLPDAVLFRRPTSDKLDSKLLLRMIRDGVAELFGDYGSGMVSGSLQVKYISSATSTAIVRVAREHYRLVWAALTFITRLPKPIEQSCVMHVVRVSGTIKKAEEEAIRRARLSIKRARRPAEKARGVNADFEEIESELLDGSHGEVLEDSKNGIEDSDEPRDDHESDESE